MIEVAAGLFQSHGYRGLSWRALVKASGTPWGSIQHHFPGGKEELGIAAVEHGATVVGQFIVACFDGAATPAEAVESWFHAAAAVLAASDYRNGCPVAGVSLDADETTPSLSRACATAFDSWTSLLGRKLEDGGVASRDAASLATAVLATFEGALLLARTQRDASVLHVAAKHAARMVAAASHSPHDHKRRSRRRT